MNANNTSNFQESCGRDKIAEARRIRGKEKNLYNTRIINNNSVIIACAVSPHQTFFFPIGTSLTPLLPFFFLCKTEF